MCESLVCVLLQFRRKLHVCLRVFNFFCVSRSRIVVISDSPVRPNRVNMFCTLNIFRVIRSYSWECRVRFSGTTKVSTTDVSTRHVCFACHRIILCASRIISARCIGLFLNIYSNCAFRTPPGNLASPILRFPIFQWLIFLGVGDGSPLPSLTDFFRAVRIIL